MKKLIFGYTWDQIKNAQQKGALGDKLPLMAKTTKDDICTKNDLDLFTKHGVAGLKEMQFHGVLDRLTRAGIIAFN